MKKICILGANLSTGNMGVGALLMGALKCLNHAYPEARFFVLDYSVKPDLYQCRVNGATLSVPLINIRFSKKIYLANNIARLLFLGFLAGFLPFIVKRNECLRQLSEADMVVSIAGGDSFSDLYGLGRFVYVALPQLLAVLMNKKLVLMPQTLGPFNGFFAKSVARFLMRHARDILSRDEAGIADATVLLGGRAPPGKVRFCYDTGFVLDPVRPVNTNIAAIEQSRRTGHWICGVNISGLLWMGGYSRRNMFDLKTDYRSLMLDIIRLLLSRDDAVVLLVPHVFGTGAESDTGAIRHTVAEFPEVQPHRLRVVSGTFNPNEIKYLIGLCNFFIGARMHACIAAVSQCIPTVSIAYSDKFIGVMKSIGMESNCVDPRTQETGEITTRLNDALGAEAETRALLRQAIPRVQQTVLGLFKPENLLS